MTDSSTSLIKRYRLPIAAGTVVILVLSASAWLWATSGRQSTDDAQVDAHVTQIAGRVGGPVLKVAVNDNEQVEAGALLVQLDPSDYRVALDKARAELADAEASVLAADANVPITVTTTASGVSTANGSVQQALGAVEAAKREVDAACARQVSAQAKLRETEATATKARRDVERFRGLLMKDELSQQQFDAAVAAADAATAAADAARSQITEAEHGILIAESRLVQAQAGEQRARAELSSAQTGPDQVRAMRARAASAKARAEQARASLAQAELNLRYATITAPVAGIVSRKSVEVGQVIEAGQPLLAIIPLDNVWITANYKETQLTNVRAGQPATVTVDAYGGRTFKGHVDSVAAATGARFSLLPPENATGNYVKVVQRVPVKIVLERGQDPERLLRPGLSVIPTVFTR